jgi:transketolase
MSLLTHVQTNKLALQSIAHTVRALGMDSVLKSKSGHVGVALGCAEMGTLLYFAVMHHSPKNSRWINRDRFVLSAGHGSIMQYALLHLAQYNLTIEDLKSFRQLGSATPGHPEFGHTHGVEVTTGPLGQGIANAVGIALGQRILQSDLLPAHAHLMDHNTYVIMGDGCMMEGVSSEASSLAGHLKLNKLIALYDCNNITIDGTVDITFTENVTARYLAYGWNVLQANSHDLESLALALDTAHTLSNAAPGTWGPTLIVCKGVAGKGSPAWEGKPKIHGNPMSAQDVIDAKSHLKISALEFHVPEDVRLAAESFMAERTNKRTKWDQDLVKLSTLAEQSSPHQKDLILLTQDRATQIDLCLSALKADFWELSKGKMATRTASGKALNALSASLNSFVGGSADLAGSNNTTLSNSAFINAENFAGHNIHFGVREHAMAAIANGIALHSAFIAYCATFAVFSDYMRPAIRLAALMKVPSIFVLTHDSYAVGEDGPTHQPVEHLSALRAIPNLNVIRPADGIETFAAWMVALESHSAPTALILTRQEIDSLESLGAARTAHEVLNAVRQGAGIVKDFETETNSENQTSVKVVLVASGSEVSLALKAARELKSKTIKDLDGKVHSLNCRVVSAPSPQLLARNPILLNSLVPLEIASVAIEAGSAQGWGEIVGRSGAIICMNEFGASAPASKLDDHFGFSPAKICDRVLNHLNFVSV